MKTVLTDEEMLQVTGSVGMEMYDYVTVTMSDLMGDYRAIEAFVLARAGEQRDELLAALEELIELCTPSFCECEPDVGYQCRACHPSSSVKAAKAAIASVKGGAA